MQFLNNNSKNQEFYNSYDLVIFEILCQSCNLMSNRCDFIEVDVLLQKVVILSLKVVILCK